MIITPTVGRVVWFYKQQTAGAPHYGPLAAHVAAVHGSRCVTLMVIGSNGVPFSETSVPLIQDGDQRPLEGNYCEWMPYQKGQAAKAEQLEKQVAQQTPST